MKIIIESENSKLLILYKELELRCKMSNFNIQLIEKKEIKQNLIKKIFNKLRFK